MSLNGLNHLLKASSKAIVEKCINITYASRNEPKTFAVDFLAELLSVEKNESNELFDTLLTCIDCVLQSNEVESLVVLFEEDGEEVNPKLKQLVAQILQAKFVLFQESSSLSRPSLPQLVDVDWFIDLKRASNAINAMEIPSVNIRFTISDPNNRNNELTVNKHENVSVEFSQASFNTMLEGLTKIRDQLCKMG